MRLLRQSNGTLLTLPSSSAVGGGGEADIYPVPQEPSLLAKIYRQPTEERARKLAVMLANPPEDPMAAQGHISIAWPTDLVLRDGPGRAQVVGFLMRRVTGLRRIFDFFNPQTRREQCPLFNFQYLLRTARNVAAAMHALHVRGYVIGDVNESNILVAKSALVTLVDTDSFQLRDPQTGIVFRCPAGSPRYTPAELHGQRFANFDRTVEHDLFGVPVLLFQLLMEGTPPSRVFSQVPVIRRFTKHGFWPATFPTAKVGASPACSHRARL